MSTMKAQSFSSYTYVLIGRLYIRTNATLHGCLVEILSVSIAWPTANQLFDVDTALEEFKIKSWPTNKKARHNEREEPQQRFAGQKLRKPEYFLTSFKSNMPSIQKEIRFTYLRYQAFSKC